MTQRFGCMFAGMAGGAALALALAAPALAAYPDKPITLVVPFPPGGAVDTLGRLFAESISAQTGQPVIVENKGGANGNIGTEAVVKSAPDGYTLLIAANGLATNPTIYPKRTFNEVNDLRPVAYIGYAPLILVVAQDSPYKTLDDLIKAAKAKPGTITYATSGSGSAPHLASELLRLTTNTQMVHVPYKGGSAAKLDLVTGRVSFMLLNPLEAVPQVQAKKLRALMVDSDERLPQLPDVPTARELGHSELEAKVWWGFAVPKRTPDDVVEALNARINAALKDKQVQDKLKQMAVTVGGGSTRQFDAFFHEQVAKWADVVKKAGVTAE
ncbi:Tripartite tricarboxylate transporter family receptor [Pigmentiphaga humi]|uniref:Tripartite tricarboxylate transporter family receptor n=1 Tax=Pigmentiphaga humi TaxID=2478468 RepID=A0A3P4B5R4_9BURK|nr:tripartite tricarboxylate transporter substrate binding protein [Pigmentiphaga humi]VCU71402.1 Tripartite tricarboxylate transporter family receptor [Pigmentiphaga humi]